MLHRVVIPFCVCECYQNQNRPNCSKNWNRKVRKIKICYHIKNFLPSLFLDLQVESMLKQPIQNNIKIQPGESIMQWLKFFFSVLPHTSHKRMGKMEIKREKKVKKYQFVSERGNSGSKKICLKHMNWKGKSVLFVNTI